MTIKDLISQYVDTGLQLPAYQISKLSNQDRKTYIRKRLIAVKNGKSNNFILNKYELQLLDKGTQDEYLKNRLKTTTLITDFEFNLIDHKEKLNVVRTRAKGGYQIHDYMFDILSNEEKKAYVNLRIEKGNPLTSHMLDYLDEDQKEVYIDSQVKNLLGNFIPSLDRNRTGEKYPQWFEDLDDKMRILALNKIIEYALKTDKLEKLKHIEIEDKYYPYLNSNKKYWLKSQVENNGYDITNLSFKDLSNDDKIKYANRRYGKESSLHDYAPNWIKPYLKSTN